MGGNEEVEGGGLAYIFLKIKPTKELNRVPEAGKKYHYCKDWRQ